MFKKLIYLVSFVLVLFLVNRTLAQEEADVLIRNPDTAMPVLDGVVDDVWSFSTEQFITIVTETEPTSPADCAGSWRALWNWEYLYVLVDVDDEALVQDSDASQGWLDDRVEVFVDGKNNKETSTDENDFQYNFRWNHGQVETPVEWYNSPISLEGVEYAVVTTSDGYLFEIKLPWSTMIGGPPLAGQLIGIDVMIDDDDDGGGGDTQMRWHTETPSPHDPSQWGTAKLVAGNKAGNPSPANGAIYPETWANLSWLPGPTAVSHDIYFGDNFDDVNDGTEGMFLGNQTETFIVVGFPGFAFPDGLAPGMTYYWRVDAINAEGTIYKGDIWSFSIPPKTAYNPNPADAADTVGPDVELSWTPGFGAKLHTVYFGDNFDDVSNATGGQTQGTMTYTHGTLKMAKTYYWRVDEFDVVDTFKGDVWSFTTEGAVSSPDPANGAVDVTQSPILTWVPGVFADTHEVYFGTDAEAVKNADTSSPEYKGTGNFSSESYDVGNLEWNTTYYWRIDEANNANADSPWTGPLWSFTTANFLIIDDMESYNDINEGEEGSNRIYLAWIDGYDNPAINGSVVGNDPLPIAEQTIVQSGLQSMPMAYNNAVGKSEATLTLTSNRDWTVNGVNTLVIWFRGETGNAAEQMYVTLNGNARIDHDDPDAATSTSWKEWNIDLQAFADQGVNLANVNTITLGLGNRNNPVAGGSGMMYFDDIRLYAPAP